MDDATKARLHRATRPRRTGDPGTAVVRRADLTEALAELAHCHAIADGTAFDADDDDDDLSTPEGVEAAIARRRETRPGGSLRESELRRYLNLNGPR